MVKNKDQPKNCAVENNCEVDGIRIQYTHEQPKISVNDKARKSAES
jgi:hypothetical protein